MSLVTAAAVLTAALVELGKVAPARTLGQDTVERCRRVLGPDDWMTLTVMQLVAAGQLSEVRHEPSEHPEPE